LAAGNPAVAVKFSTAGEMETATVGGIGLLPLVDDDAALQPAMERSSVVEEARQAMALRRDVMGFPGRSLKAGTLTVNLSNCDCCAI
jgi:hypothetical protein